MRVTRPIRRAAKRLLQACQTEGTLDEPRVRQVVQLAGEATHRSRFALLGQFHRLVRLADARRTARVESAIPLSDELRARVEARLRQVYGSGLRLSFTHRPELIGGLRIQVADDVYDGSVRGSLSALEASL